MKLRDLELPIVNRNWMPALRYHRRSILSDQVVALWQQASETLPPHVQSVSPMLLWMFEALLQIAGLDLPRVLNASNFAAFDLRLKQLHAAVSSRKFHHTECDAPAMNLRNALMRVRRELGQMLGCNLTWHLAISVTKADPLLTRLIDLVEDLPVDPVKVRVWQGWVCRAVDSSRLTYQPITPILDCFGENFAMALDKLCVAYHASRCHSSLYAVRALAEYCASMPEPMDAALLRDPAFSKRFFFGLYEHLIRTGYAKGELRISALVRRWRGPMQIFFDEYLFASGLVARPIDGMPCPRHISVRGEVTHVKDTESGPMHEKLLTPVPLELADDEAFELIYSRIKHDFILMQRWAWSEVKKLAGLLEQRKRLAKVGTERTINPQSRVTGSTDRRNPNSLANAAATFEAHGYPCYGRDGDLSTLLFEGGRAQWAAELAVPTSGALVPHCAVIVSEHPQVTPSFLEELELFGSNGKLIGIAEHDAGHILIGAKMRRGADLAEQQIILNERSWFAVDQVIQLTEPLRNYLRKRGDQNWRYLLLSSRRGFGYPGRVNSIASLTSNPSGREWIAKSYQSELSVNEDQAQSFADRFSLSAVRASAGVMAYFETKSADAMSKKLGHAKYDPNLLDRYLPRALRQFFEERWIRIFQTGILVQALKDSKFRLKASGFRSMDELDRFLMTHAIRVPPEDTKREETAHRDPWDLGNVSVPREVTFGLNEEILTTLLSLELAAGSSMYRAMHPKAQYWAEITRELVPVIEVTASKRPDILEYLRRARAKASPHLVEGIAYASSSE